MSKRCKHDGFIRYTLDNSHESHRQRDAVDDKGRPYRDVPMQPAQAFGYAAMIGSSFKSRTICATCCDCQEELPL